jgi:hypothetical protein
VYLTKKTAPLGVILGATKAALVDLVRSLSTAMASFEGLLSKNSVVLLNLLIKTLR